MDTSSSSTILGDLLAARKRGSAVRPYALFIGAGCSLASGGPPLTTITSSFRATTYDELCEKVRGLSPNERYALLRPLIADLHPSKGSIALAELALKGYFSVLFTTNWDDLLERSLIIAGGTPSDFIVLVNTDDMPLKDLPELLEHEAPGIKIVKLHGDLHRRRFAITPEETSSYTEVMSEELRRYFRFNDLLVVGSAMNDMNILHCFEGKGASIWYVNPHPPESSFKNILMARGCITSQVTGPEGEFEHFMCNIGSELLGKLVTQRDYLISSHLLIPCYPCSIPKKPSDIIPDSQYLPVRTKRLSVSLSVSHFNFPVAVWHLTLKRSFPSLSHFASWRRSTFNQILSAGFSKFVLSLDPGLSKSSIASPESYGKPGYVFSICELHSTSAQPNELDVVLKLISNPRLLLEENTNIPSEAALRHENHLFQNGLVQGDFVVFGMPKVSRAYASWSGLSYQILDESRALGIDNIIYFELAVQALWYFSYLIGKNALISKSHSMSHKQILNMLSNLLMGDATEHAESRAMREAVIQTSRLESVVHTAHDILLEESNA